MRGRLTSLVFFCLSFPITASELTSARRNPDETFQKALQRNHSTKSAKRTDSVRSHALKMQNLNLDDPLIPTWGSMEELVLAFDKIRDLRFLRTEADPKFFRRLSWLYPDDGCFDRAAQVRQLLSSWGIDKLPAKIFSMGELKVKTEQSRSGYVYWYYHVVPIVRVAEDLFVIDPAIEPSGPLALTEWAGRQSEHPENLTFSICNSFAYSISSLCLTASEQDGDNRSGISIKKYLDEEWDRQIELGRDPVMVLGEHPPWAE